MLGNSIVVGDAKAGVIGEDMTEEGEEDTEPA